MQFPFYTTIGKVRIYSYNCEAASPDLNLLRVAKLVFYIRHKDLRLPVFCSVTLFCTFHVFSSKQDENASLRICFASESSIPFKEIRLAHVLLLRSSSLAFFWECKVTRKVTSDVDRIYFRAVFINWRPADLIFLCRPHIPLNKDPSN